MRIKPIFSANALASDQLMRLDVALEASHSVLRRGPDEGELAFDLQYVAAHVLPAR